MDDLFKCIGKGAWLARALNYWGHLKTARFGARAQEKNSTSCVTTASAPTNDRSQIRLCRPTLWGLCCTHPLNNGIFTACEYAFDMNPFFHASTKFACQ